jgi:hypothetical protein
VDFNPRKFSMLAFYNNLKGILWDLELKRRGGGKKRKAITNLSALWSAKVGESV